MHIENEVKLDFKDVLIRPKRSTLSSPRFQYQNDKAEALSPRQI